MDFGRETTYGQIEELETASPFAHRSLSDLLEFGREAARLLETCTTPQAKKAFWQWSAQQYGQKFVEKAIALWRWWLELTAEVQQQIQQINLSYWPMATALSLQKLGERLEDCLAELAGLTEVTVRRIEQIVRQFTPKRPAPLRLGQIATEADWHYLTAKLELAEDEIAELREKASELAAIDPKTGKKLVMTDDIVDVLPACGYEVNLVLCKEHRFQRELASTQQELANEKQGHLAAQAKVNENYAQLREAQIEIKEQQAQLQEKETEIEQSQAEIARLREQLAEWQRQARRSEVPATAGETGHDSQWLVESPTSSETAPAPPPTVLTVDGSAITQEHETQNFKDITPFVLESNVTSNEVQTISNLVSNYNNPESAGQILYNKSSDSPRQKQKRKRTIFLAEMSRLGAGGMRC
jgi:hypothetical protein